MGFAAEKFYASQIRKICLYTAEGGFIKNPKVRPRMQKSSKKGLKMAKKGSKNTLFPYSGPLASKIGSGRLTIQGPYPLNYPC
jgi:hypothetical protein